MAKRALYGNHIEKACGVCQHGRRSVDGQTVLCRYKGVVPAEKRCRRFVYDPLKRIPVRMPAPPSHSAEEFSLE